MPYTPIRSSSQLVRLFEEYGRCSTFSDQAFDWLYDYLCEYEDSTGTPLEIDVVGLCCDYSEDGYDSIASSYSIDLPEKEEDEDDEAHAESKREAVLDYLNDHTGVLGYDDDTVLFAAF